MKLCSVALHSSVNEP